MVIPERQCSELDLGSAGALFFADCAVVPDPSAEQLAEIARATAENARAMLGTWSAARRVAFLFHQRLWEARAR